jgi:hypothetical protein
MENRRQHNRGNELNPFFQFLVSLSGQQSFTFEMIKLFFWWVKHSFSSKENMEKFQTVFFI